MKNMHSTALRILVVSFFILPLFVIAQTSTSTTAQPPDPIQMRKDAQVKIDAMVQDYLKTFPTNTEIQSKALESDITIKTVPEYPGPNETIETTIVAYLTDLNRAKIVWMVNGRVVENTIGKKTFSFQNGNSGKKTKLAVEITPIDGERIYREFFFTPMGTTILWEADTYTPPFYKGKPLLTPQARVRVIAVPDTVNTQGSISAGNLVYQWEKDGSISGDMSGYGKNSFSFMGPNPYGKTGVSVSVSSLDNTLRSKKNIDLPLTQPFILFYEDHPLLGKWFNRSLGSNLSLTKKEFSVTAEPYFFSNERGDVPTLSYNWSLNDKNVNNSGHTITLRNETGVKGDSSIALSMYGTKQTFQSASKSLLIHFTANENARPNF